TEPSLTTDQENQIPFDLRVLQHALTQVVSEEDAECLARMIIRLTDAADAWADTSVVKGEQLALKIIICFEVMRSFRKDLQQTDHTGDLSYGAKRSFSNICLAIKDGSNVLANEEAWQDFVKYSPKDFQQELLQTLEKRLAAFKDLGPLEN
ncbi:MAG: hypothetical protein K2X81_13840, partial [Candidatus Obscuribacterales bacterium]|nr:hypothetical protein [Candidatus Obscuribacterales bacterium]